MADPSASSSSSEASLPSAPAPVQAWWAPWCHQPAPRADVRFPAPPLPCQNVKAPPQGKWGHHQQPLTRSPQRSPLPQASRTLYWGINLDWHQHFFNSLLEAVPEADIFFTRFPSALRKDEFHVTLLISPQTAEMEVPYAAIEGRAVRVEPLLLLITSKLICLSVRFVDLGIAALCSNRCPHVTIALSPGTKAYHSNSELELYSAGQLTENDPFAIAVPVGDGFHLEGKVHRYFS